jgi:cell division protein FtsL
MIAVGTLAAALVIASLRVSILRLRYQLSAAVTEETELLAQQREITVELRELRDPTRLRELAKEQGFVRPERVIQLSVPSAGQVESAP